MIALRTVLQFDSTLGAGQLQASLRSPAPAHSALTRPDPRLPAGVEREAPTAALQEARSFTRSSNTPSATGSSKQRSAPASKARGKLDAGARSTSRTPS